jgi:hypothetical protein
MTQISVIDAYSNVVNANIIPIGSANTANSVPVSFATDAVITVTVNNNPTITATSNGSVAKVAIADPSSGAAALVQAFHNADNQSLSGTVYGIMTGGVDQLLNGSGNLDRKRGVSGDAMAVTGLAAEVPMIWNGTSYDRVRGVTGDAVSNTGIIQEAMALYNNSTYDRARTIIGAIGQAGVGSLAVEETGRSFVNITTGTTTTVKSGNGFLHAITINTPIASNTIAMYANTTASGAKIGTITLPANVAVFTPTSIVYDIAFTVGLTIVTSGATDITVSYR